MSQYLKDTLSEWKRNGSGNLREILDAIRSPPINNRRLASDLEKKWKDKGLCEFHYVIYTQLMRVSICYIH